MDQKRPLGWDKVIFTHVVIIGIPAILYYFLRLGGQDLFLLHILVATMYLITAIVIIAETVISLFRRYAQPEEEPSGAFDRFFQHVKMAIGVSGAKHAAPTRPVPRSTFIVAAYLPNEQEIIIDTLQHLLTRVRRPADGLEVILAYNSPVELPVETELRSLAARYPELRVMHVEESESKADNLNAGIRAATGEIVGILDADHQPMPDCFEKAWRWLAADYDIVQGRNIIRNYDENAMTRMIAVEFECIYGISHPARSLFVDTGIFGGSNGYWRKDVFEKVKFDPRMMTEDIDASSQALLEGYHIMHDRSIVSTELAPHDFRSFWLQRKRWSQGWLEVSLKYQRRFWTTPFLSIWQKIYWTYLLMYRETYPAVTLQIFPIILSLLLYQGYIPLTAHWFLWVTAIVTLLSGPFQTIVAIRTSLTGYSLWYTAGYGLFVFFYAILKNMISVVALYDNLLGRTDWVVTRRRMTERMKGMDREP